MGFSAVERRAYSFEEYLALSEAGEYRYEFEDGEIIAMGRTTDTHEDLAFNLKQALRKATSGRRCRVHKESVALEVETNNRYYLPDVMLTCDQRDHADRNIKRYPELLAEVISSSTVKRDREIKFRAYLKLPTLKYYLLIAQDRVRIEVFSKMKKKGWAFNYYESTEDIIDLDQIDIQLSVADIYEEVELIGNEDDNTD